MYFNSDKLKTNMNHTDVLNEDILFHNGSTEDSFNMTFTPSFTVAFSVLFYRYMFIVIYSIIFIFCIVGNTLVLIVTAWSARMKTRTNFFLANLAVADLCVGVLCVLPNLHTFLYFKWLLGKAMCKVHYFAESFALCASVLFLAVIAVERYIAVMHPLRAKGLFTTFRMHTAQFLIWMFAALYNVFLLFVYDTFSEPHSSGSVTEFCIIRSDIINLRMYFTFNFVVWYVLPLVTMSVAYAVISWTLWHSGTIFNRQKPPSSYAISNTGSSKVMNVVREQRSSYNASSTSSYSDGFGNGTAVDGNHKDNAASLACEPCRETSISLKGRCCYGYSDNSSDRSQGNSVDEYCRTPTKLTCQRHDNLEPPQLTEHLYEYSTPMYRSWYSSHDAGHGDDVRNVRQTSYVSRLSCAPNKANVFEMYSVNPACLHNDRSHSKRSNGNAHSLLPPSKTKRRPDRRSFISDADSSPGQCSGYDMTIQRCRSVPSHRVLSSRRKVVRLLVFVLLIFAICVLPSHVRLLMFHWDMYPMNQFGISFFPPLSFICLYLNSALNPVLYSLFSESFRRSLRECLRRTCQKSKTFILNKINMCSNSA